MKKGVLILSLLMFFIGGCASALTQPQQLFGEPLGSERAIDDFYFPDDVKTGGHVPVDASAIQ